MDEYFDIIDENNQPTGERRPRSEAHTLGLWHRSVHIYFYRRNSIGIEILVHLRSENKDLKPNCWDTRFGGHVTAGQTVEQTAISEVKEETGLDVDPKKLFPGPITKRENFPNNEYYYVYFYEFDDNIKDLIFQDHEVQAVKWLSAQDIVASMEEDQSKWAPTPTNFKPIIQYIEDNLP